MTGHSPTAVLPRREGTGSPQTLGARWWSFRRPLAASAGLVGMVVWLSAVTPSRGSSRDDYFFLAAGLFVGWWPVLLVQARYWFPVAVGVALAASVFLAFVALSALPMYMSLSVVVAALFAAPPWKAPTTPWAGSDALRVVAILVVGAGTAVAGVVGFGFLVVPSAGPAVTICFTDEGSAPAHDYMNTSSVRDQMEPWLVGSSFGGDISSMEFEPFTPDAVVDAVVRRAEQDPSVDRVVRAELPSC